VFYPGGHRPLWDLSSDKASIDLIESMVAAGNPVTAVCHGPAALVKVKGPDGRSVVTGRQVTGLSNSEEAAAGLTEIVPFLIEDTMKSLGSSYVRAVIPRLGEEVRHDRRCASGVLREPLSPVFAAPRQPATGAQGS
jgi:putative intracellular protease/amidase